MAELIYVITRVVVRDDRELRLADVDKMGEAAKQAVIITGAESAGLTVKAEDVTHLECEIHSMDCSGCMDRARNEDRA